MSIQDMIGSLRFALLLVVWTGAVAAVVDPSAARAQGADASAANASAAVREAAYYVIETVSIPPDVVLEVGGLALLPSGDIAAATRRGDVWIIENPNGWGSSPPHFRLFARGLHEPLGLALHEGALYAAQRGELTRLADTDGDGRADVYDTVFDWDVSGNYHEYSFGPVVREDGSMIVTLNLSTVGPMASLAKWRGWMLEISPDGDVQPLATGMRSPAGLQVLSNGDIFYAENQGDWIGSGWLTHVEKGDFVGHPEGLRWSGEPGSPLALAPSDIPDTGEPMFEVARRIPELKTPAVWLPHGIIGVSSSGILEDTTRGAFGPFAGQLFVGDQGHSKIFRIALERVEGVYQGVVFPFREGFQSGVLRMIWDREGGMYVGMTSRGWDATGGESYGLQRVRWSGMTPFEATTVHAAPDGFEIVFTLPVDSASAVNAGSYEVTSFTYHYHSTYGSPVIDRMKHTVQAVELTEDGGGVRIAVDSLRDGYIYELTLSGVRSQDGEPLLHDTGYYTLNRIPDGAHLAVSGVGAPPTPAGSAESASSTIDAPPAGDAGSDPEVTSAPNESGGEPLGERGAKRVTSMPDGWSQPDATITIGTQPGLRYDLDAFTVSAGARVELSFRNEDDMLHNLLVVLPGTADRVAMEAIQLGLEGAERGYVPESDDVLFHTALLQPGTAESIYFTAPTQPGEYTFVCTFPGHAVTMRGTMRVTP